MGNAERVAARRAETLSLIAALSRRLDGILEAAAFTTYDDEHDPEGSTIAYERAQVAGLLAGARGDLTALDEAAIRIADGTYGRCQRCARPIAAGRLDALPATTTCIDCAE
jgi:RNA polymerase-binding transcription factor DksA